MYCPSCGHQNEQEAKFCNQCGKPLPSVEPAVSPEAPAQPQGEPGRGGLILALGIVSVILLGLITGIPAWVMGSRDRKKIQSGRIAAAQKGLTTAGMVLGIIGTFLTSFAVVAIIVVTMTVVATVVTTRAVTKGATAATGLAAVSPEYGPKAEPLATYSDIDQIRGQTSDDPPGFFLLQLSLGYATTDAQFSVEIGQRKAQIQDLIMRDISQKSAADLSASHWDELEAELQNQINAIMNTGKIRKVNFLSFIVSK